MKAAEQPTVNSFSEDDEDSRGFSRKDFKVTKELYVAFWSSVYNSSIGMPRSEGRGIWIDWGLWGSKRKQNG